LRYDSRVNASRLARCSVVALSTLVLVATAGCNLLKKKKDKVLWSCDMAMVDTTSMSGTHRCTDVYADWHTCRNDEKKSDKPCSQAGAIAGCKDKDGDYIEWFSPNADRGFVTVDAIGQYCYPGTTIMPGGAVVAVKTPDQRNAEELKKYMDESGPKAKATLANVAAIAAKFPAATGKVDLQGLKGDVLLVHKEDFASLESPKSIPYRIKESGKLAACSRIVNGRKLPSDEAYELSYCAKNPIIAVLSVTNYAPPAATGTSVSGNTKTTYVKNGSISGDVFFFRTDNGKYLGSTAVGASNDENNITVTSPQIMTERLLEKWPDAVLSEMKRAAPGITNISFTLKK
jgi:hypothetical protein